MLDRPLWPIGHGLTSKRLGNNLKVVRLGNKRGKRCFYYLLDGHVISNDLLKMLSMTSGHKYWLHRVGNISNEIKESAVSELCSSFQTNIRKPMLKVYLRDG